MALLVKVGPYHTLDKGYQELFKLLLKAKCGEQPQSHGNATRFFEGWLMSFEAIANIWVAGIHITQPKSSREEPSKWLIFYETFAVLPLCWHHSMFVKEPLLDEENLGKFVLLC